MSEFYPTTYASFYTTFVPFDDYDHGEGFQEQKVLERVPIQILNLDRNQYQVGVDDRGTTVGTFYGRVRGHHPIKLDYLIEDERTGERYSIDSIDLKFNPVGDRSWVLELRRVPPEAGA